MIFMILFLKTQTTMKVFYCCEDWFSYPYEINQNINLANFYNIFKSIN